MNKSVRNEQFKLLKIIIIAVVLISVGIFLNNLANLQIESNSPQTTKIILEVGYWFIGIGAVSLIIMLIVLLMKFLNR